MDFTPTFKSAAGECLLVAVLLVVTLPAFGWITKGAAAIPLYASLGVITAAIAFTFYFLRFLQKAPRVVRITDDGVTVQHRSGEQHIPWSDIHSASHESSYGLKWNLNLHDQTVVIRDDGFDTSQWDDLARTLKEKLNEHNITFATDRSTASLGN